MKKLGSSNPFYHEIVRQNSSRQISGILSQKQVFDPLQTEKNQEAIAF